MGESLARRSLLMADQPPKFSREQMALFQSLTELLSFAISNQSQNHRASFFILSNPISRKIVSLLYIKDKPLRHGERHAANLVVRKAERCPSGLALHPSLSPNTESLHSPVFYQE